MCGAFGPFDFDVLHYPLVCRISDWNIAWVYESVGEYLSRTSSSATQFHHCSKMSGSVHLAGLHHTNYLCRLFYYRIHAKIDKHTVLFAIHLFAIQLDRSECDRSLLRLSHFEANEQWYRYEYQCDHGPSTAPSAAIHSYLQNLSGFQETEGFARSYIDDTRIAARFLRHGHHTNSDLIPFWSGYLLRWTGCGRDSIRFHP